MPKEDYLLKYLEKLSRVIAAMFGFRDKGFPEDALQLADECFKELFGINQEELDVMPFEHFVELIKKGGYSAIFLEILAKLLYETAKSKEISDNSIEFHQKALEVYILLNEKDKTFSFEREMIISELKELIEKSK